MCYMQFTDNTSLPSAHAPPTIQQRANQFVGRNSEKSADDFVKQIPKLSDTDVAYISKRTEGQSSSQEWKDHRVGRITASLVHQVYTKVNTITYPQLGRSKDASHCVDLVIRKKQSSLEHLPAVKYGITTEPDAKKKYTRYFKKKHKLAQVNECGLYLHKERQYGNKPRFTCILQMPWGMHC